MTPGRFAAALNIPVPEGEYWAVRCDDPDRTVPGRTWTTEVALARRADVASFGLRLVMATSESEPRFLPSIPIIVRQLAEAPGLTRNGRRVTVNPVIVDSADALDRFVDLLLDPRRRNPIFAISLDEAGSDTSRAIIDANKLAVRCIGIAHVAIIAGAQAFGLSDIVGKSLSVFRRAVRTYRPRMTIDDDPFRHPLALPTQIENWAGEGSDTFANMLVELAARNSIQSNDEASDLPPFTKAKQISLSHQRSDARVEQDYPALLALAEEELREKEREIDALEAMIGEEETRRRIAEERASELEGTNAFLRGRVVDLEKDRPTDEAETESYPDDYVGMEEWASKALKGRLRLTGRALRDAKDAAFSDVALVYDCLSYLGNQFWRMKTEGGMDLVRVNEQSLVSLGVRNEPSGSEHLLREQGDTFLVQWGPNNQRRLLDMHLKNGGNTRDPSRCLRIYYFWDDDSQQVVVGSLPAHLDTRAS